VVLLLILSVAPAQTQVHARPDLVLWDLWDSPHRLEDICADRPTLFYICDTELSVCREGAVFFDAKGDDIEGRGFRAVLIFTGEPPEVRDLALRTGLAQPVYVDPDQKVFGTLLEEKILPAVVLVDGNGRRVRTMYGGGESLEGNINVLLRHGEDRHRTWWLIVIAAAAAAGAVVLFLAD
jgi:hypothetical protein